MIAIQTNNIFLDLPNNFSFGLVIQSPIYFGGDFNFIPGTYSIPTEINDTDRNRRALGYPSLLSNTNNFNSKLSAKIFIDHNLFTNALLTVKVASNKKIKIQLFADIAALQELKTKQLSELNFEDLTTIQNPQTAPITDSSLPYRVFRIYNPDALKFQDETSAQRIEYEKVETINFWNGSDIRYFSPQPLLSVVINQIFKDLDYTLNIDFFNDPEYKELCLYNNRMISNNEKPADQAETIDPNYLPLNIRQHLPSSTSQATLLKEFCKLFGGTFKIDNINKIATFIQFDTLTDQTPEDWSEYLSLDYDIETDYNFEGVSLSFLTEHDSFATDNDKLKNISNEYTEHTPSYAAPANAVQSDVYLGLTTNYYFQLINFRGSNTLSWSPLSAADLRDQKETGQEIKINLSPLLLSKKEYGVFVNDMLHLTINQEVTQSERVNETGLRVVIYRGLSHQLSPYQNQKLPYANNYEYDSSYNDTFNRSLRLNGQKGIYKSHWQKWNEVLKKAKPISTTAAIPNRILQNLDTTKPIRAYNQRTGTFHNYFIKTFKPTLKTDNQEVSGTLALIKY